MTLAPQNQEQTLKGVHILRMTIHQYRRLYQFTGGYLVLLALGGLFASQTASSVVTVLMAVPFAVVLIQTMVAFVNPDADLAAPGSHYPPFLLRLPVRTHVLALWPMIAGSVWAALAWVTFAGIFLNLRGVHTQVLSPAIGLMAIVLSMQALMWTPFRFGALRLLLMLIIPLGLAITGIWLIGSGTSSFTLALLYTGVCAISGSWAWNAVIRARTTPLAIGSFRFRERPAMSLGRERPARLTKPFQSRLAAQVWMEWKLQGRLLPIVTVVILAVASLPLFLDGGLLTPINGLSAIRPWVFTMIGVVPFVPVVLATWVGMGARKPSMRSEDGAYHLFNATRPLMSSDVILAKVLAFTIGTAVTWATTLGVALLWLLLPASDVSGLPSNGLLVLTRGMDGIQWACILACLFGLIALTWRNQYVGVFVDYVPKRWIAVGYPMVIVINSTMLYTIASQEELIRRDGVYASWLPSTLGVYLAIKLGVAVYTATKLVGLRPSERRPIRKIVAAWGAASVVAGAILAVGANLPAILLKDIPYSPVLVPILFGAIVVPITRPLLARYSLEVGRHR